MEDLRRPEKIWERQGRRLCLSRLYLIYLYRLIQISKEEEKAFEDLGVRLTEDKTERIEDLPGTAAFIEGDRA